MHYAKPIPNCCFFLLTLVTLCVIGFSTSNSLSANETCMPCIQSTSKQIRCLADDIKCDVKSSLKGEKGYVKIIATNARIRVKAAAICRRIERNCDYRGLCRDVEKLNELACNLKLEFNEAITYLNQCKNCPTTDCHCKVGNEINSLVELARGLKAIVTGEAFVSSFSTPAVNLPPQPVPADLRPVIAPTPTLRPPLLNAPNSAPNPVRQPVAPQSILNR